jgi:hypothetical protein
MSIRNRTTKGTTDSGLPKRNPNGSNPPNSHEGSGGRSNSSIKPITDGKPDEINGPADGPDTINR